MCCKMLMDAPVDLGYHVSPALPHLRECPSRLVLEQPWEMQSGATNEPRGACAMIAFLLIFILLRRAHRGQKGLSFAYRWREKNPRVIRVDGTFSSRLSPSPQA